MVQGDATWHDGPGWYWIISEYPEEGSCGAFPTYEACVTHATTEGESRVEPRCRYHCYPNVGWTALPTTALHALQNGRQCTHTQHHTGPHAPELVT